MSDLHRNTAKDDSASQLSEAVRDDSAERRSEMSELSPHWFDGTTRGVDALVDRIQALGDGRSMKEILSLGELVHRAYRAMDADSEARRASFRKIADHPRCQFKVTTIWRAVAVYELSLRLPHLVDAPGLGVSHLRAVIGLSLADQDALLTSAARERWTKRRLEQEAASRRRAEGPRRGRPPLSETKVLMRDAASLAARADAMSLDPPSFNLSSDSQQSEGTQNGSTQSEARELVSSLAQLRASIPSCPTGFPSSPQPPSF